jgi:hypothetical protein
VEWTDDGLLLLSMGFLRSAYPQDKEIVRDDIEAVVLDDVGHVLRLVESTSG